MMRLKVEQTGKGLHPNEVLVIFKTVDGTERLMLSRHSLVQGAVEVGGPLRQEAGRLLVELPRETQKGAWRVWVTPDQLLEPELMRA